MKLIKKILGTLPEQQQVSDLIGIISDKPDVRLQETRKRNFQRAIQLFYKGNIPDFAKEFKFSVFFLKGLLAPPSIRTSRQISIK